MAKFSGKIGYIKTVDDGHGVWTEEVIEKQHYGDILKDFINYRTNTYQSTNDNITMSNQLSIVATPFSMKNFQFMKYATIWGAKWKITNVEVKYPRLILTLGDVYND